MPKAKRVKRNNARKAETPAEPPKLPGEITDNILNLLLGEEAVDAAAHRRVLRRCSAVCKRWRSLSLPHLYETFDLRQLTTPRQVRRFLKAAPGLVKHIEQLSLLEATNCGPLPTRSRHEKDLADLAEQRVALSVLHGLPKTFVGELFIQESSRLRMGAILGFLSALATLPPLLSLGLSFGSRFSLSVSDLDFETAFWGRKLLALDLSNVEFDLQVDSDGTLIDTLCSMPKLQMLKLSFVRMSRQSSYTRVTKRFKCLRGLRVDMILLDELPRLQELLARCTLTLEWLQLSLPVPDPTMPAPDLVALDRMLDLRSVGLAGAWATTPYVLAIGRQASSVQEVILNAGETEGECRSGLQALIDAFAQDDRIWRRLRTIYFDEEFCRDPDIKQSCATGSLSAHRISPSDEMDTGMLAVHTWQIDELQDILELAVPEQQDDDGEENDAYLDLQDSRCMEGVKRFRWIATCNATTSSFLLLLPLV